MKNLARAVVALTLIVLGITFPFRSYAAVNLFNFGGYITYVYPCTCSPPILWILVIGPKPGAFVYIPGVSVSYMWYMLYPSVATKGNYLPSIGQCWMYAGVTCVLWPSIGQITQIGTSLVL